jgi:hypothetical protein
MSITFRVDDVAKAAKAPATRSLREHMGEAMAFGGDGERRVLSELGTVHPLLGAVHVAFAEHRPLVLSPDVVWLTILAGVTQHVRLNAERLRDRFVRHRDKKRLAVIVNVSLREQPAAINEVVPRFRELLAEEVGQGTARLLTCDFSTTTDVERMASEIMLMDTFSPYFQYDVACVCGIPELTLLGEPDDWQQIRERVDILAEFELDWWTTSLAPILDEFVRASRGGPNVAFFRDIYQPRDAYGGETTVGWAARLYPYLFNAGRYDLKNPLLEKPLGWRPKPSDNPFDADGIKPDRAPSALGACRITVDDHVLGEKYALLVRGGLAAIEVDEQGRLVPLACWSIVEDRGTMRAVIESIRARADARYSPPEPRLTTEQAFYERFEEVVELVELNDAFGELRLFDGVAEWRLRAPSEQVLIEIPNHPDYIAPAKRLIDLADGSFLAYASHRDAAGWGDCLVCIHERDLEPKTLGMRADEVTGLTRETRGPTQDPHFKTTLARTQIPIVARSLTELFERAIACDGKLELAPIGFLSND